MSFLFTVIFAFGFGFYAVRNRRSRYWGVSALFFQAFMRFYDEMKGGFSDAEIFAYSIALTVSLYWLIGQVKAATTKCPNCEKLTLIEKGKCEHCGQTVTLEK